MSPIWTVIRTICGPIRSKLDGSTEPIGIAKRSVECDLDIVTAHNCRRRSGHIEKVTCAIVDPQRVVATFVRRRPRRTRQPVCNKCEDLTARRCAVCADDGTEPTC